jgi:hypothetical protein
MSRIQLIGIFIFVITLAFCAKELVPGWSTFHLGWPNSTYYLIAAVSGAIGGALIGNRYLIAGLISGPIASAGALFMISWHLSWSDRTSNVIEVLFGALGCLPGLAVYGVLAFVQKAIWPSQDTHNAPPDQSADQQ